jgi:hypothetical protein
MCVPAVHAHRVQRYDASDVDALDTEEGGAFAREILEALEHELVRFRHRVLHDHGIELDRARAAMILLGKLVGAGIKWRARPDSDPARIHEAMSSLVPLQKDPKVATALKREIATFFAATADVEVLPDDNVKTSAALLRRVGSDPSLWWWAASYAEPSACWTACGGDVDRLIQVALAIGVNRDAIARALASSLATLMTRVKTRPTPQRDEVVATIERLSAQGTRPLDDPALAASITKLAFEMTASQHMRQLKSDPIYEIAVHLFQLVDALKVKQTDVERLGAVAGRMDKLFVSRGIQLAGLLRKDLDTAVEEAIARLLHA